VSPTATARCAPLSPGTFDGDCARDDQCASGTCARIAGEHACRCHVPCDDENDGGWGVDGRRSDLAIYVLIALLVVARPRRPR